MSDDEQQPPKIYGGITRTQARGKYELTISSDHSNAGIYGTLPEIRVVLESMQEDLAYYEKQAASRRTGAGEGEDR